MDTLYEIKYKIFNMTKKKKNIENCLFCIFIEEKNKLRKNLFIPTSFRLTVNDNIMNLVIGASKKI